MGRLAGPVSRRAELRLEAAEREMERRRQYIAAITPLAHPSSHRRQAALLWLTSEQPHGIIVGHRGYPPLTSDMRALLTKGYLRLRRRPPVVASRTEKRLYHARWNLLSLTPAGEALLSKQKVSKDDKIYILRAYHTGVLR